MGVCGYAGGSGGVSQALGIAVHVSLYRYRNTNYYTKQNYISELSESVVFGSCAGLNSTM